ncbi:transposase IS3/IS911 family protein [Pandoraea cepalis]|uniref:Transposase IS3/IS911 family protein n=1 Tax=Pandoraea cepalis TaxID=2508294 RepID=A0A5E4TAA2_9BURK|nr:transposase IS3/IS911 family protein [Pandoraea cepalis]
MKKSKFTDEQIAFALKQAQVGTTVAEVCRKMSISEATFYNWRRRPRCAARIQMPAVTSSRCQVSVVGSPIFLILPPFLECRGLQNHGIASGSRERPPATRGSFPVKCGCEFDTSRRGLQVSRPHALLITP